jgi:hypothetical protein
VHYTSREAWTDDVVAAQLSLLVALSLPQLDKMECWTGILFIMVCVNDFHCLL